MLYIYSFFFLQKNTYCWSGTAILEWFINVVVYILNGTFTGVLIFGVFVAYQLQRVIEFF